MPIRIVNFDTGSGGNVYLNDGIYSSTSTEEGSWRMIIDGSNLSRQRYESGVWVEKAADTP